MTNKIETECPVCGPADRTLVGECHDLPVVRCVQCSLMFVGECDSVEDTEEFFRSEHVDAEETTELHYVNFRKESLKREAAIVRRLVPDGGRLLDVGTASGYFLKEFDDAENWRVEGVEPSAVSTQFAQQRFGLNVRQGYLAEQNYAAESFDVVSSLDAFNCHRTPNEDLAEMYRILKPGGFFVVEFPGQNYRMLTGSGPLCRLFFGCSLRLNAGVNFFFYTTEALVRMASRVGFEVRESHPEAMPSHGRLPARMAKFAYFRGTSAAYRLTGGRLHLAPKELIVFQKNSSATTENSGLSQLKRAS
ncbi:class I SAM-dependent methyltransferase [Fuerstiella marisgermanici]|uniref:Methionine biosynthesis protein n=1 Tax=Fuerstiella marisgermanici TaxID=1891926 RepID=A0A1P8WKR7_9PLAN|nr:class I SAM-dependent methyltransferase [Fuerstiella marisgermanici]APZ94662.1 methionine biosynthesis protein [Fuerstiella marisgermanici]